jgi:hypothetical protein
MLLVLPLALLAPRTLHADPTRTIEIDIVDTPKAGAAHTARCAVSVVEDGGWFAADVREGPAMLHLGARIDRKAPTGPQLTVQVSRKGARDLDVQAARGVAAQGAQPRVLMGRVENDEGRSEVFVTVR